MVALHLPIESRREGCEDDADRPECPWNHPCVSYRIECWPPEPDATPPSNESYAAFLGLTRSDALHPRALALASEAPLDFAMFLSGFRTCFGEAILEALSHVMGDEIDLRPTPLSFRVQSAFARTLYELSTIRSHQARTLYELSDHPMKVCFTFHGTPESNLPSIYEHGLVIPGRGNNVLIANGAAHGHGIYTANGNAPWLAARFCGGSDKMLVCAVLQTPQVEAVRDAQVIFDRNHVVPLLVAIGSAKPRTENCPQARLPASLDVSLVLRVSQAVAVAEDAEDLSAVFERTGFTLAELKAKSAPLALLKQFGYQARALQDAGFTDLELLFAGFPMEPRSAGGEPAVQRDMHAAGEDSLEVPFNEKFTEKRIHPVYGELLYVELQRLVPEGRCQATWSRMRRA